MKKVGDIVRVIRTDVFDNSTWAGRVGVIIAESKRLHIPAFKIMLSEGVVEFDHDELELVRS